MSKNYCGKHEVKNKQPAQSSWLQKIQAFLAYLRRPKTVFDFKDRTKALLLLAAIILSVQYLVKIFVE
ncbi:hypothetical protein [uncultured Phascolarctobacterium sp.]|uniref:hypothetical protein n=1 Tax=Phascolarctobacterium sp. TaxID=2049039 RepID=UPI0025CDAE38|nr:hypothetical protein [uncultured Phascolarctobacterium sp.]